jgi:ribosomal protein S6
MEKTNTRVYELGFLLVPTTAEGQVAQEVKVLTDMIETAGGTIVGSGTPEFIDLAYRMEQTVGGAKRKWTQGYFGWVKFEIDAESIETIKKALDGNFTVFRYILVKTSVSNTVVFKKPKVDPRRAPADEPIDEEALEALTLADEAQAAVQEEGTDDLADHEKLPDLTADVEDNAASEEA